MVSGWGIALPDKVVTNDDLSARLDTSDAWITERTGIRQRYIGGTTSELAVAAGRQALERAGRTGADIDLLVLATTTPDAVVPGTSATVQDALGVAGGALPGGSVAKRGVPQPGILGRSDPAARPRIVG